MMFMVFLLVVVLLVLTRWLVVGERQGRLSSGHGRWSDPELIRLREEVDRLSAQVERLSDDQSFLLRLLDERQANRPLPPASPRPEADAEDPRAT